MARDFSLSADAANVAATAISELAAHGVLALYSSQLPPDADHHPAVAALVEIRLTAPAFCAPAGGEMALHLPGPGRASRAGTIRWWCLRRAAGGCLLHGTAGTSGADLIVEREKVAVGDVVNITELTYRVPLR